MIDRIIKEIKTSLENGCPIVALTSALTLPDICGKAMYPEIKHNKQRFVKWFDENIHKYESILLKDFKLPYISGEIAYSLRCSLLHEGNPNIDYHKFDVAYFELVYGQELGCNVMIYSSDSEIIEDENKNKQYINKKISVNVWSLCNKICMYAKMCYEENKVKFDFFNYNLINIDYQTKRLFRIK